MKLILFTLAMYLFYHGFSIGGTSGFMSLMFGVVVLLFWIASHAFDAPMYHSRRPRNNRKI